MLTTNRARLRRFELMAAEHEEKQAARIRERRKELDLSQGEVAARFDNPSVNKDYISRWERAANVPSGEYLADLAKALETTVADLAAGPRADQPTETPDLVGALNGAGPLADVLDRLQRIERTLNEMSADQLQRDEMVQGELRELRLAVDRQNRRGKGGRGSGD